MMTNGPGATIGEMLTIDLPRRATASRSPRSAHTTAIGRRLRFPLSRQAHVEAA
jgi:hypothetical protein